MELQIKPLRKTIEDEIVKALIYTRGNKLAAARILEIHRNTLTKHFKTINKNRIKYECKMKPIYKPRLTSIQRGDTFSQPTQNVDNPNPKKDHHLLEKLPFPRQPLSQI